MVTEKCRRLLDFLVAQTIENQKGESGEKAMSDLYDLYSPELKRYARIHGHICFGLAMGYRAGKIAQTRLGTFPKDDNNKVVVWLETGGCAQDGIELITPCGCHDISELILDQESKYVFIFYYRKLNKALRLIAKPEIMKTYRPVAALKAKMRQKTATPEEIAKFWKITGREVIHILELPDEAIFTIQSFDMVLLMKLNPFEGVYVPMTNQVVCSRKCE
jgi:formylmethanofuran dehydrogenase subunit E